jgi:hypothetical protein
MENVLQNVLSSKSLPRPTFSSFQVLPTSFDSFQAQLSNFPANIVLTKINM